MAGLTYFFANLETNPLESAWASDVSEPSPHLNVPVPVPDLAPVPPVSPSLASAPSNPEPQRAAPTAEAVAATEDAPRRDTQPSEDQRKAVSSPREQAREQPLARLDPPAPRLEFPEFSDSSRAERRERAADGPRIEGLFERRQEPLDGAQPAPGKPETSGDAPIGISSCEAAIARNNEQLDIGGARGPADVTREQYAGLLQNGRYLAACSIPDRTVFEICAAVRDGRAVGVTVTSSPASASLNACVRRAVASLKFPQSPRLDVTHTRFDAARR
jgi:hypothetical protein